MCNQIKPPSFEEYENMDYLEYRKLMNEYNIMAYEARMKYLQEKYWY